MFFRMIFGSLFRQKGKALMIAFTIALGSGLSTAMLNTMLGVGDKVNQELKTYGANINVLHKEASLLTDIYGEKEEGMTKKYLREDELYKIKTIFWAYNIVDYAPFLNASVEVQNCSPNIKVVGTWFDYEIQMPTGQNVITGIRKMRTWWEVEGEWVKDEDKDECMVGSLFAGRNGIKVGDELTLKTEATDIKLKVVSIFNAGSDEDEQIFMSLSNVQKLLGIQNVCESIEVSALTTPDNDLARKAARNPLSLTIKEKEVWYCTAYVSSICYQIQEVLPDAVAKPIRRVAESEGAILNKTTLLMLLITILSLLTSALGISNLVTASVIERRSEIGLKKAIGASNLAITIAVLTEVMIIGIFGGAVGYFAGIGLTQIIGHFVFASSIPPAPMVIPVVVIIIFLITLLGSLPSVRYLLKLNPTEVLHGK